MFGKRYIQNARRPEGIGGSILLSRMNVGHHAALAAWGLGFLPAAEGCCFCENVLTGSPAFSDLPSLVSR